MGIQDLSKTEKVIFDLIGQGLKNGAIAKKLFRSPRTIETHRHRILMKLGLNSTTDIVKAWIWEQIKECVVPYEHIKNILGIKE